jgi:multiple sugar transport system permease protein
MTVTSAAAARSAGAARPGPGAERLAQRGSLARVTTTGVLLVGAFYCLLPVLWVLIAATKTRQELFSTFTLAPGLNGGLLQNLKDLSAYRDGEFWQWTLNSVLYAGVGSVLSVVVSAAAGFALAKYRFRGRNIVFNLVLGAVLLPQIALAVPQYLLLSRVGLADTYWSVLLPGILSPFGIYLMRVYAAAAVPDEMIEAARIDGAGEFRVFTALALPVMVPGLVTAFLLQFVASWNNFLLPYVMLSDDRKYPMTVGLYTMLNQGANQPSLYSLVIVGALLAVLPLVVLFLFLQRYWQLDLVSGAVKA